MLSHCILTRCCIKRYEASGETGILKIPNLRGKNRVFNEIIIPYKPIRSPSEAITRKHTMPDKRAHHLMVNDLALSN